jgi:hypothetical protein
VAGDDEEGGGQKNGVRAAARKRNGREGALLSHGRGDKAASHVGRRSSVVTGVGGLSAVRLSLLGDQLCGRRCRTGNWGVWLKRKIGPLTGGLGPVKRFPTN